MALSKVTIASRFSKITLVLVTPATLLSAALTVIGQAAQVMLGTASVTVCGAAHTGAAATAINTNAAICLLMTSSGSVKERKDIRKCERNEHQRHYDPEDELVGRPHLGNCADLARCTRLRWAEDAPAGKNQRQERRADKDRAIGLERCQVADPRTAEAKRHQDQRA